MNKIIALLFSVFLCVSASAQYVPRPVSTGRIASDPLTLTYLAATGTVQTQQDIDRVDRCFSIWRSTGILPKITFAVLLQSQYNVSGSTPVMAIGSGTCTLIGGATLTKTGAQLNLSGTGHAVQMSVSDMRVGTVLIEYEGASNAPNGLTDYPGLTYLMLSGTGGFTQGSNIWVTALGASTESGACIATGSQSAFNLGDNLCPSNSGVANMMSTTQYLRTIALSTDNAASPTINAWLDGTLGVTSTRTYYNQSFGSINTPYTQANFPVTMLTLGAKFLSSGTFKDWTKGSWRNAVGANTVLSTAEVQAIERGLRQLDERPINVILNGDSTTQMNCGVNQLDWGSQIIGSALTQNARLYNVASNGQTIAGALTAGSNVDHMLRYAPDGAVTRAIAYMGYGINDVIFSSYSGDSNGAITGTTAYANLKIAWSRARAVGIEMHAETIPAGNYTAYLAGGLAASGTLARNVLNTYILSDPSLYAGCERVDLFMNDTNNSTLFLNALHATTEGNRLRALNAISGGSIAQPSSFISITGTSTATPNTLVRSGTTLYFIDSGTNAHALSP